MSSGLAAAHFSSKQGMHFFSPANPLQEWPQGNIFEHADLDTSWHSFFGQISSKALMPLLLLISSITSPQYLHLRICECDLNYSQLLPIWYGMALQVLHCYVLQFTQLKRF
jgi:hypothetical protein